MAARRGTELHEFAHKAIQLGIKLPKTPRTIHLYVNDAIAYKMYVEVCLYYSSNCFGHADAISFRRNKLRIHDLKTGIMKASMHQLEVYAALFCLEYSVDPFDIETELRIYQNNDVHIHVPTPEAILMIMDTIVQFDKHIEALKESEEW